LILNKIERLLAESVLWLPWLLHNSLRQEFPAIGNL